MTTTHVHDPVIRPSNELIAAKARDVHPVQFTSRMLLTTIAAVFVALGWTAGTAWFVTAFSFLWVVHHVAWFGMCIRHGYHKGARHVMVPIDK